MKKNNQDDSKQNPGPEPERFKIEGDWEDAVKKAMAKPKPDEGWPQYDGDPQYVMRPSGLPASCYSMPEGESPAQYTAEVGDQVHLHVVGDPKGDHEVRVRVTEVYNDGRVVGLLEANSPLGSRGLAALKKGESLTFTQDHIFQINKAQ